MPRKLPTTLALLPFIHSSAAAHLYGIKLMPWYDYSRLCLTSRKIATAFTLLPLIPPSASAQLYCKSLKPRYDYTPLCLTPRKLSTAICLLPFVPPSLSPFFDVTISCDFNTRPLHYGELVIRLILSWRVCWEGTEHRQLISQTLLVRL